MIKQHTEKWSLSMFSVALTKYLKLGTYTEKDIYLADSFGGPRAWHQRLLSFGEGLLVDGIMVDGTMVDGIMEEVRMGGRDHMVRQEVRVNRGSCAPFITPQSCGNQPILRDQHWFLLRVMFCARPNLLEVPLPQYHQSGDEASSTWTFAGQTISNHS